ncbi:MAG: hypothetical protein D6694_04040 [Gammaproteobacteria bacterium]|nr:MAG: hypothetical protein D6694_04040 [Gammaproteobacteria bacterium]
MLPSDAPEVVDGTLGTLVRISQRISQTSSSGRALKLAISSATQQLISAEQQLDQLSRNNQWNQLVNLINSLSAVSSAIYGIYILSSQDGQDAIKEACAQLTDELTNLEALHEKLKEIEQHASKLEQSLEEAVAKADQNKEAATQHAEQAEKWSEQAEEFRNSAEIAAQGAREHEQTITELADQAEQLAQDIDKRINASQQAQEKLETLTKEAQEIRATLESLLPGATAAGLANAYRQSKINIEERMKKLFTQFYWGLFALMVTITLGHWILPPLPSEPIALMLQLLTRGMLAAPAIWFTWVVARQYAYLSRLHTDYGFKEAMATSFEGFRRMMEELDENDHKELTAALSVKAIEIISSDPDRLTASYHGDESPFGFIWRSLIERIAPNQGNKDNGS